MIIVSSPRKPFEITLKGKPARNKTTAAYAEEIERLYEEFGESSSQSSLRGWIQPTPWSEEHLKAFVGQMTEEAVEKKVGWDDDIFALGCDR